MNMSRYEQNIMLWSGKFGREVNYWKEKIKGDLRVESFPFDFPNNINNPPVYASYRGIIPDMITDRLLSITRNTEYGIYLILLADIKFLMSKYNGNSDVIAGMPLLGRNEKEDYTGGLLPIRSEIWGNCSFKEFLGEIKLTVNGAVANCNFPVDRISEISGNGKMTQLFSTVVLMENIHNKCRVENTGIYTIFEFSAVEGTIELCLRYNSNLYKTATIEGIVKDLISFLAIVIENPGIKLCEIDIVSEELKRKILHQFNGTKAVFPGEKTIHRLFEEQVEKTPDTTAVVFEAQKLTYMELNNRSNRLARELCKKGVSEDRIVGIMVDRSLDMAVGLLGILKAGGAYLPIDPQYPTDRIRFILEDSGTTVLLTQERYFPKAAEEFDNLDVIIIDSAEIYTGDASNIHNTSKPENLAYVIYTSGSTGKPKGVMIEHRSLVNRLNWMQKKYPIGSEDVILQKTPYTFDVSVWELFWWAIQGAQVCFLRPGGEKDPQAIAEAIEKNKVTVMHFVPSMLNAFLEYINQRPDKHKLRSLRQVFASGEALLALQVNRFNNLLGKAFNIRLSNLYGPTEATVDVSYYDCPAGEEVEVVPIGKPIDNTGLYILDRFDKLQAVGVPGELHIAGAGLARGYLNRPELTTEKFTANPFLPGERMYRTGDLARWLPDGNIEYLGRIDHQVKIRGYRIELGEIENCLLRNKHIKDAVVTAREDKEGDKYLCAYIVGDSEISSAELKEYLSDELPEYMVPSFIVHMEKMPLTSNGKVDRKGLPEPDGRKGSDVGYVAPANETEKMLAGIWQEVLGVEKTGVLDNFFELGGHSLLLIKLQVKLEELGIFIDVPNLINNPTIRELARYLNNGKPGVEWGQTTQESDGLHDNNNCEKLENSVLQQVTVIHNTVKDEDSKVLDDIKPFNEIFYRNCYYNNLFSVIGHYRKSINPFLVNDVCVFTDVQNNSNIEFGIHYESIIETKYIFDSTGIAVDSRISTDNLVEDIIESIVYDKPVIIFADSFYQKGKPESYQKNHWFNTLLIYGYDRNEKKFNVIENKYRDSLMYTTTLIDFNDIENAYYGYMNNLHGNEATYYAFSSNSSPVHEDKNIDDLLCHSDLFVYCKNIIKVRSKIIEGISHLDRFYEDFKTTVLSRELLVEKSSRLLKLLTDIVNSRKVEKYKNEKLLVSIDEYIDGQYDLINAVIECWSLLRSKIAKYIYSGKHNTDSLNTLIEKAHEVCKLEKLYCRSLLDMADNIIKTG